MRLFRFSKSTKTAKPTLATGKLTFSPSFAIEYKIRRHKRAKNITLRLKPDLTLAITIPHRFFSEEQALTFAKQKHDWIYRNFLRLQKHGLQRPAHYLPGRKLLILGQEHLQLNFCHAAMDQNSAAAVEFDFRRRYQVIEDQFFVNITNFTNSLADFDATQCQSSRCQQFIKDCLADFYRREAKTYLSKRTDYFCNLLGKNYRQIRIKNQKSRWGSCSKQQNINYNFRIMMAPKEVIDYLVAHEVAHLQEMNHSPSFWQVVESIFPEYQQHRQWLRKHGHTLVI